MSLRSAAAADVTEKWGSLRARSKTLPFLRGSWGFPRQFFLVQNPKTRLDFGVNWAFYFSAEQFLTKMLRESRL